MKCEGIFLYPVLIITVQSTLGFATSLRQVGQGRETQRKSLNQVDFSLI